MKTLLKIVLLSLMLLPAGIASAQTAPAPKIATFDLGKVFTNYYKTKLADANIKDRQNQILKDENSMIEDYKKGEADYKALVAAANDQALSADQRDKKKVAADAKYKDLQQSKSALDEYDQSARAQLNDQSIRMREKILGEIHDTVTARAKAGNYSMIIDVSAATMNGTAVIFYSNGQGDITEDIIKQLNVGAPIDLNTHAASSPTNRP